jgi:hypothetical protein
MAVGTPALVGGQHVVIRLELSPHASAVLFVSHENAMLAAPGWLAASEMFAQLSCIMLGTCSGHCCHGAQQHACVQCPLFPLFRLLLLLDLLYATAPFKHSSDTVNAACGT